MSAHKLFGNNRHFFKGRFISGPDWRSCIASLMMILVPSILWQIQVGPFFADRYSIIIPIATVIIQVLSIVLLVSTAFSDPGIMPRAKDYTETFDPRTKLNRTKPPPRYHDLVLRGHPFRVKYCTTCNIYRPPRCTHCSVCENCIERFDHHCPWLGNCIGKRNYWLFFSFVTTTGTLNVTVLGTSVGHLAAITQDIKALYGKGGGDAFVQSMREEPITVALAVYSAAIVWFTVGLCLYHSYLICTNQTTYEQIKGVYSSGTNPQNPFYRGILGNIQDILCSRIRPRYFNAWDNRLLWNATPANEAAREIRFPTGRGEKRYSASGSVPLKGLRDGVQAPTSVSNVHNDPFLTVGAGGIRQGGDTVGKPRKQEPSSKEENEGVFAANDQVDLE